ncbi:MAG TPA: PAS domain-containing sensor histidine kinase [Oligoflexus sp.]|uniref:sensor histidine kinase n=1 Tax=Oligoflexus sp. TaxID=1971216 RepID=UPI002D8113C4|nr:PAS domain-containing sensor histidine kinase [Oligoflexus sp.]HET9238632.1 PAS domain-containing sensor histidine kinase [Oligoflexus sp.]
MNKWEQRFKTFSFLACLGTVAISLTALLGMYADKPPLRQWFDESPPMRFNTAVALGCAGVSLILRSMDPASVRRKLANRIGLALGFVPFLIGFITLLQYSVPIDLGVDHLFSQDKLSVKGIPGRPAPETALNLTLLGLALILNNRREPSLQLIHRLLSALLLVLPLITLISAFLGADQFYSMFPAFRHASGAATNTAVASVLLSFALLFRPPYDGLAGLFIQETVGGVIARRQLIAVIVAPFFIVFVSRFEYFFGQTNRPYALAWAMLFTLGGLLLFNWLTARELDRLDQQRQKDELKLKNQEQLLSGVLDAVPVGIWITDSTGKITRGNPAGIEIWRGMRYVGIEQYGEYKGWWAHNGQLIGAHEWALARALEKGETSVDETIKIECFDGSHKVVLNSAMPLRNESGGILGAIVTNYDISRRYRLERNQALVAHAGEELIAMRDVQDTLQRVTSLMTEEFADSSLIYLLDETGVPRLVSKAHNSAISAERFEAFLNRYAPNPRTRLGVLGVLDTRRSVLISNVDESVIASIAQNAEQAAELRKILHSYMFVPMIAEDKKIGVLGFISYERTRHYDELDLMSAEELGRLAALAIENARYAERLKQAVQAREDVVAIVSHDLRSPLTVIMQSCDLITKQLTRSQTGEQIVRIAQLAKSASRRMHELIANLLDLSHLDSNQFVLHYESFEGMAIIRETIDLLRPFATEKSVQLKMNLPDSLPLFYMDRTRFCQILNNLITNAIKYTPADGTIDLSVHLREDGWLEFNVTDTGVGIKEDYLPLLFERYWKPHDSKGGFGLGLFVVKGIVEAHGGQVRVTSEEGRGTSFTFTLPSTLIHQRLGAAACGHPATNEDELPPLQSL